MVTFIPAPPEKHISIQPGAHISPDVGLSDDFTIMVSSPEGQVQFCAEPREWLEELRRVVTFRAGARYEYQLLVSAAWFRVRTFGSPDGLLYQFTVFDVNLREDRDIMLSAKEVAELTQAIENAVASASA
jgi:hypothetical protein